jgi:3-dehydroquinate synthase
MCVIPEGEEHKNLDTMAGIYRFLIENGYDRKTLLAALGGGVVGDMTGFAAATYLRGVDFIQIPTTLLSQADSSIGGKTGIDFEGYKNMIGAFCMPKLVYSNVGTLKSLDGRQFSSGFAEVMKHGLIRDDSYYEWLLENMYEILGQETEVLQEMLLRSNEIKKAVVEADPLEKGERMLLNLGHTLGHAIEKYMDFTMTHGECVALGCVAAAWISWKRDLIEMEDFYEIRDMFVPFGLPICLESLNVDKVLDIARSDKKAVNGKVRFVLLKGIGQAFVDETVTDEEIRLALKELIFAEEG